MTLRELNYEITNSIGTLKESANSLLNKILDMDIGYLIGYAFLGLLAIGLLANILDFFRGLNGGTAIYTSFNEIKGEDEPRAFYRAGNFLRPKSSEEKSDE